MRCEPNFSEIPQDLLSLDQWVLWRKMRRDGRMAKLPICVADPLSAADVSNSSTWSSSERAISQYKALLSSTNPMTGIGFVFSADDGFAGIDIDDCRDAKTGLISLWARRIIDKFGSYTEVSPSGTGVKIFVRAELPGAGFRSQVTADGDRWTKQCSDPKASEIEIYDQNRYFTVTGRKLKNTTSEIRFCQDELDELVSKYFRRPTKACRVNGLHKGLNPSPSDDELLEKARSAANGDKFVSLFAGDIKGYPSQSEADQALCNMLAHWSKGDEAQIDRMFRRSGLMRSKWDRKDYRQRTIGRAIEQSAYQMPGHSHTDLKDAGGNTECNFPGGDTRPQALRCTDTANAERLNRLCFNNVKYVSEWKRFIEWDGRRWKIVDDIVIQDRAKKVSVLIFEDALKLSGDEQQKLMSWARQSANAPRIEAMVKLLRPMVSMDATALDRDPWLLNCPNGTLDLRDGQLQPHRRENFITKLCPTDFNPNARSPFFEAAVSKIFRGDDQPELVDFFQRICGYMLTGDVSEQVMFIFWGNGSNGKSMITELILSIMGQDYSRKAPHNFLTTSKTERHPTELADLFGKRFVVATETDDGRKLAEACVKELTGADTITARRMHQDNWSFRPTHKLVLVTNYPPTVHGTEDGIWRRLVIIPFTERFWDSEKGESGPSNRKMDKRLLRNLEQDSSAILAWMVRGCQQWQQFRGLRIPPCVLSAMQEYRDAEDLIRSFIEDRCVINKDARVKTSDLYSAYRDWSKINGEDSLRQVAFGDRLTKLGFTSHRGAQGVRYRLGIELEVSTGGGT
jgi:putative DNA primase/helicase